MADFRFEVWPTEYREITQHFGANPPYYKQFNLPGHDGIDIRARQGTKVFAVAAGKVTRTHLNPTDHNYGIHVRIEHEDGYITTYAHLSQALAQLNQTVEAGALIGLAGNTGNSFGPHLHLSLKKLNSEFSDWPFDLIDPTPFLLPLMGWEKPVGTKIDGWILSSSIFKNVDLAQIHIDGARVYTDRETNYLVAGGTIVELAGIERDLYTLISITQSALGINLPEEPLLDSSPRPTVSTVRGWAVKSELQVVEGGAVVPTKGLTLYKRPAADAETIGLIRPNSPLVVISTNTTGFIQVVTQRDHFDGSVNLPHVPPLADALGGWDYDPENPVFLGWTESRYLNLDGLGYALLDEQYGAALRPQPDLSAQSIGLVKAYATISIVGEQEGRFVPTLVSHSDLVNPADPMPPIQSPRTLPTATNEAPIIENGQTLTGWTLTGNLEKSGERLIIGRFGGLLRTDPQRSGEPIGYVNPLTVLIGAGEPMGEYTPIRIRRKDMAWLIKTDAWAEGAVQPTILPAQEQPASLQAPTIQPLAEQPAQPIPATIRPAPEKPTIEPLSQQPTQPKPATIRPAPTSDPLPVGDIEQPVWQPEKTVEQVVGKTDETVAPPPVIGLPQKTTEKSVGQIDKSAEPASNLGQPSKTVEKVVGQTKQPEASPWQPSQPTIGLPQKTTETQQQTQPTSPTPNPIATPIVQNPWPITLEPVAGGQARIGLHASTDPGISQAEINAFAAMRPGTIKLLSSADDHAVAKLGKQHPDVDWIIRAFLDFGPRAVTPAQFFEWTFSDVQRTLNLVDNTRAYIELHNEPNLVQEGLGTAWADGTEFAAWYTEVAKLYREAIPNVKLVFPGLSPGSAIANLRQDHIQFIEQARWAVESSDYLGTHLYWARNYSMSAALTVLDDYLTRFRNKPVWVTEASNNDASVPFTEKAKQYLSFWNELQKRPQVRGVTYFAASSSNPAFASEVWVGNGIAELVGRR